MDAVYGTVSTEPLQCNRSGSKPWWGVGGNSGNRDPSQPGSVTGPCPEVLRACSNHSEAAPGKAGSPLPPQVNRMLHSCCMFRQAGTGCCAQQITGAKGRPQMTELRHDTWSSSSPSGNSSLSTCRSIRLFPPGAPS